MSEDYDEECDDQGNLDDAKVDFDYEVNGPAICAECGNKFPIHLLDPSDSDVICPKCRYQD